MKKLLLFLIVLCCSLLNLMAQQLPPFTYQSNSNLKVRMTYNTTSPNWSGVTLSMIPNGELYRITDYYQELKGQNDLTISNPTGNPFFNTSLYLSSIPQNPFNTYFRDTTFIFFYGKFFFDGSSDIGIDSGIVLSTGRVFYYGIYSASSGLGYGPSAVPGISQKALYTSTGSGNMGASQMGDPYAYQVPRLQQYPELVALNNGHPIADANIFEFDVTPNGNFISLDYVFASEEWPLNSCDSGADVMAIMLSGPGIVGEKNIAVLPGTQTPVSTRTVYPAGTPCRFEAPSVSPWYVDNTAGENVVYNAFTKVLRAASIVQPCQNYHVRVMVADGVKHPYDSLFRMIKTGSPTFETDTVRSDSAYGWSNGLTLWDAGVFLKMGSLRSTDTVDITAMGGLNQTAAYPYAMWGCFDGKFRISVSDSLPIARTFNLVYEGSAVMGIDYQVLPSTVTLPAFATSVELPVQVLSNSPIDRQLIVKVQSPYGTCLPGYQQYLTTAVLNIVNQYPVSVTPSDTTICNGCSVQLHAVAEPGINYNYSWSPSLGLNNTTVANPIATPTSNTTYTVNVTGSNGVPACAAGTASAQVRISGVGLNQIDAAKAGVKIYPNPASHQIRVVLEQGLFVKSYQLTDVLGKILESGTVNTGKGFSVQLVHLSPGSYFLKLISNKGVLVEKVDKF